MNPIRYFLALLLLALPALANDPGGGTNGVGANVTLTTSGGNVILANGILSATISTNSAQISSMTFGGRQMVNGNIYFSMDGSASYEQPGNGKYWVKTNTSDRVDVGFRCTMTNSHWFNVDIHYVLGRGDSGLYVYAELSHPTNYPATGYGEWRMVWKMDQDQTERIYVDDIRNWQKPSAYDLANADPTGIAEIVKLTTGLWAGRYDCKYMYSCQYEDVGCYGHASDTNKIGVWAVFGGYDYFNDGPTKQDLAPASGIIHIHFGRNHYNGSSLALTNGEAWSKFYGPWLLYCNTNSGGGDACWADAKAQVAAEKGAWPYAWLTDTTNYPAASARGAVSGSLVFSDALKSGVNASNAWVGLVDSSVANWEFESKFYQYWQHADSNGNFTVPHVRPGTYTLHAFNAGAVGEFAMSNIVVTAGATNALGALAWNSPHAGGYIAWEIGKPDRLPSEFRNGTNHWVPYIWDSFESQFSNPINFNLDSGNPAWDLNYAHNFYGTNLADWNWNINFTLPSEPPSSNARLTIATAGGEAAHLQVYVNGSLRADFYPANGDGNILLRQGAHGKYGVQYVTFNASTFLNAGPNTITLKQVNSDHSVGKHTMYDYIALEMPGTAPAVQFLTWAGGKNTNAWDTTATNWSAYAQPKLYTASSKVLFNETGDNSTPVRLSGALTPGQVVVNAVKDYQFDGPGSLSGAMNLSKRGPGTLTLTVTNNYSGTTTVSEGALMVNGNSGSSLVSVGTGGALAGKGVIGGNATVSGTLSPGMNAIGTLEFLGNLTLDGNSTALFEVNPSTATNDVADVTGAMTYGGTLNVNKLAGTFVNGNSYKIFNAGSYGGSFTNFVLPALGPGLVWNTTGLTSNGTLSVIIDTNWSGGPQILAWNGDGTANAWDNGITANWRDLYNAATTFAAGEVVVFNDFGSNNVAVNLTGTLQPSQTYVMASEDYVFGGTGSIAGTNALHKSGAGKLTLNNSAGNTFTGGVTIDEGNLTLGAANTIGAGPVTLRNNATLVLGTYSLSSANPLSIQNTPSLTGGNSGGLTDLYAVNGNGVVSVTVTATGGVLDLQGDLSGFHGTFAFTGGNSVRFNGSTGGTNAGFDLGSGTLSINKRTSSAGTYHLGSLAGGPGTSLQGSSGSGNSTATTYSIGGKNTSTLFEGTIVNGGGTTSLAKVGSGTLTLAGTNTYTGATTVSAGTFLVNGDHSAATGAVSVASGATLGGTGIVGGATTIQPGGKLSPGAGIGTLTFTNTLNLNATTVMEISHDPLTNDVINKSGALAYAGTLLVTNTSGTLAAGDQYKLFNASSYSGSFSVISLPALNGGLAWDTSQLWVDGSIAVVVPPNIVERIYALTVDNQLIAFDSTTPGNILSAYTVSGLQANEKIVGMDFWNGTLYGLGDLNHLYTINRANGAAGLVGSFSPTMNGEAFGFEAEPGGLRLVSNLDQHLLLDYGTGTATVGATINGSPNPAVTGLAYHPGNGQRYVADYSQNTIGIMNPSSGLVSTIAPTGIDFSRHNGFDISANPGNAAYLASPASSSGAAANLYKVDLTTGSATLVGLVGMSGDDTLIRGLAVGPEFSIPPVVNLTPTNLTFSASGGNLTLSWPMDHTGWRLQTQTNSRATGLSTNWFDVPDSASTNSVSLPVDVQNGSVFYRLIYP